MEFQCESCGVDLPVKKVTCGDCVAGQETWQQMAERLAVELVRQMVRDGEQFFQKSDSGKWIRVWVGRRSETPVIRIGEISLAEPEDARDLSDCLQVAARYLEEVGLNG